MRTVEISQTPTVTVGAYHAGDAVGGLLTFANAASVYKGAGWITKVVVIDNAKQAAQLYLWLFDRTFTATADNAAFDPTDADLANCIGIIPIGVADYGAASDNNVASVDADFDFVLVSGGTSLFGQLVCVATPTYAAVGDITVKLTVVR